MQESSHAQEPPGVHANPSSRNEGQHTRARGTRKRNNLTSFPLLASSTCPNLKCLFLLLLLFSRTRCHVTPTPQDSCSPIGRLEAHRLLIGCPARKVLYDWFFLRVFRSRRLPLARRGDGEIRRVLSSPRHLFPRWHCFY